MDTRRNEATAAGEVAAGFQPQTASDSLPDQFLPGENSQGGDEWMSMFIEDCFSGSQGCGAMTQNPPASDTATTTSSTVIISTPPATATTFISTPAQHYPPPPTAFISSFARDYQPPATPTTFISISSQHFPPPTVFNDFVSVSGQSQTPPTAFSTGNLIPTWPIEQPSLTKHALTPKTKGKRSQHPPRSPSYRPLLYPTQWLADSELINHHESKKANGEERKQRGQQSRRCSHCHSRKTPQWRTGPLGPKSLCNACGVRFKTGRLYPEYRPAKSPTFETFKHSNSHKKVMEMRMGSCPQVPNE